MLVNTSVDIWNKGITTKINGVIIPGVLEFVKTIDIDLQPYSTALLAKDYGYNIVVNKRLFIDYFDPNIKIGTILKYVDKYGLSSSLEVKVIPWDDGYMEVIALGL